jgi:2,4-dienoyl-CoA reductase-like NADH-dependent reductase (Old Yellow Enzyme family)
LTGKHKLKHQNKVLFEALELPCGVVLKNRIAKSAMSDSLGDGTGHPTVEQNRLYQCWAKGGLALSIVGEVQPTSGYAEKPGNLVLNSASDLSKFWELAHHGGENGVLLCL